MHLPRLLIFCIGFIVVAESCSRKTTPTKEADNTIVVPPAKDSAAVKVPVRYKAVKTVAPKSISLNDKAAKKTVDGRFYYDLEGKRYWRSKKDGRYYLYYKGMFSNPDFQQ